MPSLRRGVPCRRTRRFAGFLEMITASFLMTSLCLLSRNAVRTGSIGSLKNIGAERLLYFTEEVHRNTNWIFADVRIRTRRLKKPLLGAAPITAMVAAVITYRDVLVSWLCFLFDPDMLSGTRSWLVWRWPTLSVLSTGDDGQWLARKLQPVSWARHLHNGDQVKWKYLLRWVTRRAKLRSTSGRA